MLSLVPLCVPLFVPLLPLSPLLLVPLLLLLGAASPLLLLLLLPEPPPGLRLRTAPAVVAWPDPGPVATPVAAAAAPPRAAACVSGLPPTSLPTGTA